MSSPAKFPGLLDFLWEFLSPWHSFPRHPASLGTSAGTVLSWRTAEVCRAGLEPQREWGSLYSGPCPYTGPPSSPSFPVPAVKPQFWQVSRAPEVLLEVGNTESPAPAAPDSVFTRLAWRRGWGDVSQGALQKLCSSTPRFGGRLGKGRASHLREGTPHTYWGHSKGTNSGKGELPLSGWP